MTDSLTTVESSFQKRSIQLTIVTCAIITSSWQALSCIGLLTRDASQDPAQAYEGPLIRLDLNSAEEQELALLPRVGPILARRIVENRERLGPFESVEALARVHGIGAKTIEEIAQIGFVQPAPENRAALDVAPRPPW